MDEINRAVTFNILDKNIDRHRSFRGDYENLIGESAFKEWFQSGAGRSFDSFNLTEEIKKPEDTK